jgi:hypothetical protein
MSESILTEAEQQVISQRAHVSEIHSFPLIQDTVDKPDTL